MSEHPEHEDPPPDEGPALVTCPECVHPNLAFRNHCRRCGARLQNSANLIPGADFLEWTATDGPTRRATRLRSKAVSLVIAACLALPLAAVASRAVPWEVVTVILVAGFVALCYWMLTARDFSGLGDDSETAAPHTDEADSGGSCRACGARVSEVDDICPECGVVVASDVDEQQDPASY